MIETIQRLFTRTARKSRTFRFVLNQLRFTPSLTGADYKQYTQEAYEKNPYVYAAISQTANSCAGIPPVLYRVTGKGRVERGLNSFEKKRHRPAFERKKKRLVAGRVHARTVKQMAARYGVPYPVAKSLATKAMVQQGELEPVDGHELLALLMEPNGVYQTSYQRFMQAFVSYLEIGGEAFIEPLKGGGTPRELYVLSPLGVEFKEGNSAQPIGGFRFEGSTREGFFRWHPDPLQTEIFYSRYFHPRNPLRGFAPSEAAAYSISINNEGRGWNLSLLRNDAQFSGILTAKGSIGQQQIDSLKEQLTKGHAGHRNAGKILAVDDVEGLAFEPISQTNRDMQWGDLNRITAREAAIVWNMPPQLLGDESTKTYANYEEARRAFYLEKIIPLVDFIFGELNSFLTPFYGDDLLLDYDSESVDALSEDVNELHDRVRKDVEAGLLTLDEGREVMGREAYPEGMGEVALVSTTRVSLRDIVMPPEEAGGGDSGENDSEESGSGEDEQPGGDDDPETRAQGDGVPPEAKVELDFGMRGN